MSTTVARRFREAVRMFPHVDVELVTACQAIIANETRLRNDLNRLGEENEHYSNEHDTSVAKNVTMEAQVRRFTEDTAALRALGTGTGAASDNCLTVRVGELEQEGTVMKARMATADAHVVQLRERNVGFSTRVDNLSTALATNRTEVKRLNGELKKG